MKQEIAEKILLETETGYDSISKKFSETRKHFWRGLEFIKDYTRENDFVLDFGCGNGRLFELVGSVPGMKYLGIDVSEKLIDIAKAKYQMPNASFQKINPRRSISSTNFNNQPIKGSGKDGFVQGDKEEKIEQRKLVLDKALEDEFFNTTYSIAVFHHFPSAKYRRDIANELFRVTKNGGHVVVTVWYLWQKKYFKNILKNWTAKIKGESVLDWNDCLISFTDNAGVRVERFHHAFTKGELKKLFESAGFETEKCEVVDGRNILYIGKK